MNNKIYIEINWTFVVKILLILYIPKIMEFIEKKKYQICLIFNQLCKYHMKKVDKEINHVNEEKERIKQNLQMFLKNRILQNQLKKNQEQLVILEKKYLEKSIQYDYKMNNDCMVNKMLMGELKEAKEMYQELLVNKQTNDYIMEEHQKELKEAKEMYQELLVNKQTTDYIIEEHQKENEFQNFKILKYREKLKNLEKQVVLQDEELKKFKKKKKEKIQIRNIFK